MKTQMRCTFVALFLFLFHQAAAQSTAFTYQGRLTDNGAPANGVYDLQFNLYDTAGGGSNVGTNLVNDLSISNGLFTVLLDFGPGVFTGASRFLEIGVRPGASTGAYTSVVPRQMITSAPYAILAGNISGTVSATQLSGTIGSANVSGTYGNAVTFSNAGNSFSGSGAGLTGLNASELASGLVPDARLADNIARTNRVWLVGGNSGTTPATHFLGTTDPQALELRVNGGRALRLEPTTNSSMVNVIAGSSGNYVDPGVVGATIAGGGTLNFGGNQNTNRVAANFGVIGGGWNNLISSGAGWSLIAGGSENLIDTRAGSSAIGGGDRNVIRADANSSTIAGGFRNNIQSNAWSSTIAGGQLNTIQINASRATIGGGTGNTIEADAFDTTIGGGVGNTIQSNASFASIGGGDRNTIKADANTATIGGGSVNTIQVNADYATIAGGNANTNSGERAFVGGGELNVIRDNNYGSTVAGGVQNTIETNSYLATIGGGSANTIQANAAVATIAGGAGNLIQTGAVHAAIGGGFNNTNGGPQAFVGGGVHNFARGNWAVIGGGFQNVATNYATTVSGGDENVAGGWESTIGGGALNTASGDYSVVGAGFQNQATTNFATVPGGQGNRAAGRYSFAAGHLARADHEGAFVWADSTAGTFSSTTSNQFSVRANGGVRLVTGGAGMTLDGQPVLSGTITSTQLADGAVGTAQIADGTIRSGDLNLLSFATTFWKTVDGNAGTTAGTHFIGTTDSQPLEFKVNSQRALRLEPGASNSVNIIGGWIRNSVSAGVAGATVAGGGAGDYFFGPQTNKVTADFGTVGGGIRNISSGLAATTGGGRNNTCLSNYTTVSGGLQNTSSGDCATVGGGILNTTSDFAATVGGGSGNGSSADYATVGGGSGNDSSGVAATVSGGARNISSGDYASVGGGFGNTNSGLYATIAGGTINTTVGTYATVVGGVQNTSSGFAATVGGGLLNNAEGNYSFAAGHRAKANHGGSFVWADDHNFDFASTAANKVRFRCTSGFDIITAIDGSGNQTAGVYLSPGDTSWNVISDRNAKKNFQPVDTVAVLDKLATIPITQWNYKWEADTNTLHLGPMAQDFKAAFFPGRDDKSISTLEFDGVELAAIQGLNERMKEKDARITALEKNVAELKELVRSWRRVADGRTASFSPE